MEQPSSINFHETLTFVVLYVILATVQAVVLMIIGFGLIARAVLLLVGPVFVPFFIVPKMDSCSRCLLFGGPESHLIRQSSFRGEHYSIFREASLRFAEKGD